MNMQSLMAQAKKMQQDIQKSTNELEAMMFEETVGAVKVEANGKKEITKVDIEEESLSDKEILEDMILAAVNGVMRKIEKEKENKLGKYSNAMGGLM